MSSIQREENVAILEFILNHIGRPLEPSCFNLYADKVINSL
jgi:hypothetical protein